MDNTVQLYINEEEGVKGYPLTSPDRVIDENGVSVKQHLVNIEEKVSEEAIGRLVRKEIEKLIAGGMRPGSDD